MKKLIIAALWIASVMSILYVVFSITQESTENDSFNWEEAKKRKQKEFQEE